LTSGPFRGCTFAKQTSAGEPGTTTAIECGGKKLVITDRPGPASARAAQEQLKEFEESFPVSMRKYRSTLRLSGRPCWSTVVQDEEKGWGRMVVVRLTTAKTRVVACSGTPSGVSKWCEQQINTLAKGHSPTRLLIGR
jgi:hypothetical protein